MSLKYGAASEPLHTPNPYSLTHKHAYQMLIPKP